MYLTVLIFFLLAHCCWSFSSGMAIGKVSERKLSKARDVNVITCARTHDDDTLLMSVTLGLTGADTDHCSDALKETKNKVVGWLQSFPFASSLPMQPMSYTPNEDGIDLVFRRKKTVEKSGKDGGLCFQVQVDSSDEHSVLVLEAYRDQEGQSVSKGFSEKMVLNKMLEALTSQRDLGVSLMRADSFFSWQT
mmetsp:Transcript_45740/g.92327  ORF Transcript_45740/g.92327 Transcript_45740/m.92327 type:complete len:192 (+) Transcript_45740:85-660(+)